MPERRQGSYANRRRAGELKEAKIVDGLNLGKYDTSLLRRFGLEPPYCFERIKSIENVKGKDIVITASNCVAKSQAKERASESSFQKAGEDLGVEIARGYNSGIYDCPVLDGGRDLYIPPYKQSVVCVWDKDHNIWKADRDWENTKTTSDFFILHSQHTTDLRVYRSDVIKIIAHEVFEKFLDEFSKLKYRFCSVLNEDARFNFAKDLGTGAMDVRCLLDGDERGVVGPKGVEVFRRFAKAILYIPIEPLQEGVDWVKLPLRS